VSLPRWVHRLYAFVAGYFWLPCPVCGRMFGGHEAGNVAVAVPGSTARKIACNRHKLPSFIVRPGDRYGNTAVERSVVLGPRGPEWAIVPAGTVIRPPAKKST
jgi:hypothetical protein